MKKNMIYSTLFLIILSTLAKILSFIVRIYLARNLPLQAMNLYSLAMPTLVFLIALAQMGIPTALSKVIAQSQNQLNGILTAFILTFINNLFLIFFFVLFIPFLSNHFFHDLSFSRILRSMIFMIPMVSLSGLCKAILQGNQHHISACFSQICEEIFRLSYLLYRFTHPVDSIMEYASIAMFSVFIGECGSTLFMLFFLFMKKKPLRKRQHDLNKTHFHEILSLSIPMTSSRLIGSLTYFLEPIIFLSFWNHHLLENSYGIFNGYVLPLLTMPSFISITLANALLPTFVYQKKHYHLSKALKIFYMISWICLIISSLCSLLTYFFPERILFLFYKTQDGIHLLKKCSLPFAFYSLQPVFSSILHALDLSHKALWDTIIGCILRIMILLSTTAIIGENALILGITISMLTTTFMHAYRIRKAIIQLDSTF
ncbi:MAG: oligosaccharide flippase family protein [Traorella sp.]